MSLMLERGARALRHGIPLRVHLDLTYRCNERCVHCYLDHEDHGELKTHEVLDLLAQLAEAGVFFLNLSGGEIFMRKDLFEIIGHARKLQFSVKLKTNGVMVKREKAQRLSALGIEDLQNSLYSHLPSLDQSFFEPPGSIGGNTMGRPSGEIADSAASKDRVTPSGPSTDTREGSRCGVDRSAGKANRNTSAVTATPKGEAAY